MTLPLGLIRLELQLLLEECLRRLALEVDNGCTKDLTIHISAGKQTPSQSVCVCVALCSLDCFLCRVSGLAGAGADSGHFPSFTTS